MTKFPSITGGQPDGRCTVVSVHRGENIGRGLLARIMRDCEVSRDELQRML